MKVRSELRHRWIRHHHRFHRRLRIGPVAEVTMSEDAALELTPQSPAPVRSSRRRTYLVLGVLVIAVATLLAQGMLSSLNYYTTVDEVFADRASVGIREVRLEGVVQKGSVQRTSSGADFVIAGTDGNRVNVRALGEPPQLFRPNIPVIVIGSFTTVTGYTFRASQIMVKHSAEYKAKHPDRVKAPDGSVR